ncbi:Growth-regulating factor 8 [Corchorus capsularis]|uniref:Growth-regulating factor n=1 Tax=Corchorus capsularis TaxID=210143 RepID=A0A1R3IHN6_COCAP|nr:Growth-regulating factor 8 [Corchorus capsularis]
MDLHLKQWRNNQHESDSEQHQPSAKIPKLLLDHHQQYPSASSALPLFVPAEPNSSKTLSAVPPDHSNPRFPRMGSYFSLAQWQELELQALIYRYMLAGFDVPQELLQPIKKSLVHSPSYFLHHPLQHYSHYQPAWYWGRAAMDPEPGRCRRTDGKKWRCSRDVVAGQKYCERHIHRGRNRSRKPVEMPTSSTPNNTTTTTMTNNNTTTAPFGGALGGDVGATIGCGGALNKASSPITASPLVGMANRANNNNFGLSRPSPPIDLLHLNHSNSDSKNEHKSLFEAPNEVKNRSDGHILRHFFDDWPRSVQEPENSRTNTNPMNSSTCLSISMPGNGNSSSDVSLKLSTGNGDPRDNARDHQPQLNWANGWSSNPVASMGGPLAEALRSSTSNSSPTSVLHQLPRGSASETSYVST